MNLTNVIVGAFVLVCIGSGAGIMAYASTNPAARVAIANYVPPPATATARPLPTAAPAPRGAVGGVYTLAALDRLWVERLGMDAWNRAEADTDRRSQNQIDDVFENFFVPAGTRVTVIVKDGRVRQLEMLDGQYAGRRGWTDTYSDNQYRPD